MDDSPIFHDITEMLGSTPPPWFVRSCFLERDATVVEVSLAHEADAQFCCAMCHEPLPCDGDGPEWVYRCVTCKGPRVIYVRFHMPQVICPTHGVVHVDVHWMRDPGWRFDRIVYSDEEPYWGTIH